jgi:hypothetical protein
VSRELSASANAAASTGCAQAVGDDHGSVRGLRFDLRVASFEAVVSFELIFCSVSYKLDLVSCGKNWNRVRKAIVSGFFMNAAKKDPTEVFLLHSVRIIVFSTWFAGLQDFE